jgi:hypothetical protein
MSTMTSLRKLTWLRLVCCSLCNGFVNSGMFEDDRACGIGTLVYSNGDIYEGSWDQDQRHGRIQANATSVIESRLILFND